MQQQKKSVTKDVSLQQQKKSVTKGVSMQQKKERDQRGFGAAAEEECDQRHSVQQQKKKPCVFFLEEVRGRGGLSRGWGHEGN